MRFEGKTVLVTGVASGIGLATAIEFVRPVLFLASDDASCLTGSDLVVDGGYLAP